jgi:hypothetical protein
MKLVIVRVHGNAVVGGGTVEFLKEKPILTLGIIEGAGKKQFQAIVKLIAVAKASLVRAVACNITRRAYVWHVPPSFCNDVDEAQESTGDIKGRVWPSDDFDSVDQVNINRELRSQQSPIVDVIVQSV